MATALDLITESLEEIGVLAIGEVPTAEEGQRALRVLNNMLDAWKTESLMVYDTAPDVFPLVAGQSQYTLGIGGQFNIPRPVKIEAAYNRDVNNNDYGIYVTTNFLDYSDIITKTTRSSLVTCIYDDGGYPLKTLTMWPIPSDSTYKLVLWSWRQIDSYALITDVVTLPPGYWRAMVKNLAIELCARYGVTADPTLVILAQSSKAQIKRINAETPTMGFEPSITRRGTVWNYLTGETV